jgi:hypothetical protein
MGLFNADAVNQGTGNASPVDAAPLAQSLAGTYRVAGTNLDGSAYGGELTITERGPFLGFAWRTGNNFEGVGIQRGNIVAVGWGSGSCGVAIYQFNPASGLDFGDWGYQTSTATGTEFLFKDDGTTGIGGSYMLLGASPDGSDYDGRLTVIPQGPVYQLVWAVGSGYDGIGITQGDRLGATWGGEGCAIVIYEVRADGSLSGLWGVYGLNATGTETATRS